MRVRVNDHLNLQHFDLSDDVAGDTALLRGLQGKEFEVREEVADDLVVLKDAGTTHIFQIGLDCELVADTEQGCPGCGMGPCTFKS